MARYFKIYNKGVTTVHPFLEIDKNELENELYNIALDEMLSNPKYKKYESYNDNNSRVFVFDEFLNELFSMYIEIATTEGFCVGDYYLYIGDDDSNKLDYDRKNK